jgi:hypothetical protein
MTVIKKGQSLVLQDKGAARNVKRVHFRDDLWPDGYAILDTLEMKTAWHPVGV